MTPTISFHEVERELSRYLIAKHPKGFKVKDPYLDDLLNKVRMVIIKHALERKSGVQSSAAIELGINRNTLRKIIRENKVDNNVKNYYRVEEST